MEEGDTDHFNKATVVSQQGHSFVNMQVYTDQPQH